MFGTSKTPQSRGQVAIALLATAGVLVFTRWVSDPYVQNVLVLTLMYAALAQSWNILGGYCGQISLGHGLYFGIGAYASTLLFVRADVSPWLGMLVGGALAGGLAAALGYFLFRLSGHYFTIATFVVAEVGFLLMLNWEWVGGALGIQIPFEADSWATLQFARDKVPYILTALALALIAWVASLVLERSKWGFWWRAIKDNPEAAESLGVEVFGSKVAAAAISAFFTAVCGSFYAQFVSYIDPESVMSFHFSLLIALPAVLGGIGTLWGPVLGAVVLIPMSELTRSYLGGSGNGTDLIIYGALILLVSLLRPQGLVSLFALPRTKQVHPS